MDFRNFFILYIFEVEKSISRSFTKLLCSGDLENPGQLPVSQVLQRTDDCVLWILVISSFPTFSRSRNPFLAVSQSYHVWVTSKIQVNFRFRRCSKVPMIPSYGFWFISSFPTFLRLRNPFLAVSRSYYVRVTSKIEVNFPFRRCLRVLMIESYRFL